MGSTIAMSSAALSRPGTTRPALSQLVAAHTSRNRGLWHSARSYHSIREKMDRIARSIDKYQLHPQANLRRRTEACSGWPATAHREPRRSKGWTTQHTRSRFSEPAGREKTYWDAELEQMSQRMAYLKKQVARDPYEALFGRRVDSSHYIDQSNTTTAWPGFLRMFLGAEKPMTDHPSKAHPQDLNSTQSNARSDASGPRDALEYDPISGRMAPKAPEPQAGSDNTMPSSSAGVECPPGSEVEAVSSSNSAGYKNIQTGTVPPKEPSHKPSITVPRPPGSELEAFFTAARNNQGRPSKESTAAGVYADCPPGGVLEAKYASGFYLGTQSEKETTSADRSIASELEARIVAETTRAQLSDPPVDNSTVDSVLDSELEARIVAETTRAQLSDPSVDCSPGGELEALFKTTPATVQATHYSPTGVTADPDVKKANKAVDCGLGHGAEVKVASDTASIELRDESENLTAMQASDIRARYSSLESDGIKSNGAENISEDRVGDFLLHQKPTPAMQQWSQADYRILAYDSASSTVTTAESDSFFGTSETPKPHEILSRLHHPARFVPYFTQMQQDGYEIATGGGDILVFKRVVNTPKNNYTPAAGQQDSVSPNVQADLASYTCDNSYDSTSFVHHYHPSPTTKPSASGYSSSNPTSTFSSDSGSGSGSGSGSSSDSSSKLNSSTPSPKSTSTFRKVLRRMILTGTITAGSCYAIGVLIEYFRTGGQDGYGADAFTPFESERRHRE